MRRFLFPALGLLALSLGACDDTVFGTGGEVVTDVEGYEGVVAIADAQCLGCHGSNSALGGLDLETDLHAATVGVTGDYGVAIVEPGDPAASMFYMKITNTQGADGTDMPPTSGGLSADEAAIIEDWILDGAPAE